MADVIVVGGGLAGCEAAWQLAERGHNVVLREMRPARTTPAHQTSDLAELVCTNSFKSEDIGNAHGLLKAEMRDLGSILLHAADEARVPAGQALAVDRVVFARAITTLLGKHPGIAIERSETTVLPDAPTVIATGPLTSPDLTCAIAALLGDEGLAFYDSIAPIVSQDSIDTSIAFYASRWDKGGDADYLNCPMTRDEYDAFIAELRAADVYAGHDWEQLPHTQTGEPSAPAAAGDIPYFEGCLPIEVMAERGADTLRFGPMKPVGLRDPRTGRRPWAVVQLRREDRVGQMWNMVGFQTRLRTGEQRRIFRMIPGLAGAEFLRMGSIHRNTYLNFPAKLNAYGGAPARPELIFAGQLTGVEGYTESAASGLLAGINMDRLLSAREPLLPPPASMLGALMHYLATAEPSRFQPMNSNFGLLQPLTEHIRNKGARREMLVQRARAEFARWVEHHDLALTAGRA